MENVRLGIMLLLCLVVIGVVSGLQNVTVTTDASVSDAEAPESGGSGEKMGLLDTSKLPGVPEGDTVNITLYERPSIWDVYVSSCDKWRPMNHLFFQVANVCLLVSFLAPHSAWGLLVLRGALVAGCGAGALWAWSVHCALDAFLWYIAFLVVNLVYLTVQFYLIRPIKFNKEIEEVYVALFKPLRVSRRQFRKVLHCMRNVRHLKCHELYAHEKVTKVDSLSLVLSGKLVVSQNQRALHIVFPHHFLDSPEWFGVSTDEFFQVSIMAMEESLVLVWHRDKLKLSIMSDAFLQAVFDHILGRDVVHKLMQVIRPQRYLPATLHYFIQVSETMSAGLGNGHAVSLEDGEDKPMLLSKPPPLTALLTRQMQATDPNAWRLGRIEETDHETPV